MSIELEARQNEHGQWVAHLKYKGDPIAYFDTKVEVDAFISGWDHALERTVEGKR